MHQQIRTSPDDGDGPDEGLSFQDRLRGRLGALASVNIQGVAPELASTHIRFAFRHREMGPALKALERWSPTLHDSFAIPVRDHPGGLRGVVEAVVEAGYEVESVLVLASRQGEDVVVSVGVVGKEVTREAWIRLGGIDDEDEMPPEAVSAS